MIGKARIDQFESTNLLTAQSRTPRFVVQSVALIGCISMRLQNVVGMAGMAGSRIRSARSRPRIPRLPSKSRRHFLPLHRYFCPL